MDSDAVELVVEAAVLTSERPLQVKELRSMFDPPISTSTIEAALTSLSARWASSGFQLVEVASGWRVQTRPDLQDVLHRLHPEKLPQLGRAALEILAVIVHRQPATRSDIEDVRGVPVNAHSLAALEQRGWIESIGTRHSPGRPQLYATTRKFLDDLGLSSLDQVPPLEDISVESMLPASASTGAAAPHPPIEGQPSLARGATSEQSPGS